MKRILTYATIIIFAFSCKSGKNVVSDVPVSKEVAVVFPTVQINKKIIILLSQDEKRGARKIYRNNQNNLIWNNDTAIVKTLQWLSEAAYHGLDAANYPVDSLQKEWANMRINDSNFIDHRAMFDISLSLAVKQLGSDISYGKLSPTQYHGTWNYEQPQSIADSVWIKLALSNKTDSLNALFSPQHKLYNYIYQEQKKILASADVQKKLPPIVDPKFLLRQGDSNKYVLPIKERLLVLDSTNNNMAFTAELHKAVLQFQRKHGLKADGVVGRNTYYFLNWDKQHHLNILAANQERLRWLPAHRLERGMVVNIPSMQLELYKKDSLLSRRRVIVGTYKTQTPVFKSKLSYLVFNPCWTVPKSIATKSMLPRLQRDSLYLQNRNMFIAKDGIETHPDSIDFSLYSKAYFPFTIYQRTGDNNALGRVKFMFYNKYSIYLHDTPSKRLFSKDIRAFSHGCVRIESATELAEEILFNIDGKTTAHSYYYDKGFPVKVYTKNKIPISLVYLTCWFDDQIGELVYYKDIYGKDYKLIRDLKGI